jgi:hypothetical protein
MPSVVEQILARVAAALTAAAVTASDIDRGNEDGYGEDELPKINLKRGQSETSSHSQGLGRTVANFEVEHHVAGAAWETIADALHMASHAVIANDAQLAALGRGLRCTGTEALGESAEFVSGKLIARYQIQFLTRPGDPTRAIN